MQVVIGCLLLLLSIIGHWELWVLLVNRVYSLRIRATTLRKLRNIHDLAFLVWPPLIIWWAGLTTGGLWNGGTWQSLGTPRRTALIVTIAGIVPWLLGVVRWQWFRKREFRAADERTVFDVRAIAATRTELGDVIGQRWHPSKAWLWNDIYRLEVNRKTVRLKAVLSRSSVIHKQTEFQRAPDNDAVCGLLPELASLGPAYILDSHVLENDARSGTLRIAHISDLHFIDCPGVGFYRFMVEQVVSMKPDLIVFTGDLIDRMTLLGTAIETLRPLTYAAPCVFILGNHDWRYDYDAIRAAMIESGWTDVAGRSIRMKIRERKLLLSGTEMPWIGRHPDVPDIRSGTRQSSDAGRDDTEVWRRPLPNDSGPEALADEIRILLSHAPDQLPFAVTHNFDLMLSGHTHGGQVVLPIVGPVYSPSRFGVNYAAGLFHDDFARLTLHVSRGIGAKDPLRWRCLPEVTVLEVHQ